MSDAVVVTSHPLAVQAGLDVLAAGGSAADAAVAASAVLTVVDPRSTSVAGDMFALHWAAGEPAPTGLAAAGVAAGGLTVDALRAAGFTTMPRFGPWTVTVPGAPAGWETLLGRFGRLGTEAVLRAAIMHARDGFAVTPMIADEWTDSVARLNTNETAAGYFLPGGRSPRAGERFANPDLAATLQRFVDEGSAPFYSGDLAEAIAAAVTAAGGPLRLSDLAEWGGPEWVTPLSVPFRGVDVFELPPPGQGVVVLESLALYGGFPLADDPVVADHRAIESLKLAFDDAAAVVADPAFAPSRAAELLSAEHLDRQRARIGDEAAAVRRSGVATDTVYVAVVDGEGNGCSLIQSLYEGFGSGIAVPGTGLVLQNRGAGFTLDDHHPNRPEPGKRPYHTIIPGMLGSGGALLGCLGVVGGYMQPQGQLQVLRNLFDRGMTPQQAVAAPRFRVFDGRAVHLEEGYDADIAAGLAARGHELHPLRRFECGGAQLILRTPDGSWAAGTDPRKDGPVGTS